MKPSKPQVKSRDFRLWRKSATRQGRFVWAEALETFSGPEKTPCCVHVNTRYTIMRVCKRYFGAGQAKLDVFLSGFYDKLGDGSCFCRYKVTTKPCRIPNFGGAPTHFFENPVKLTLLPKSDFSHARRIGFNPSTRTNPDKPYI